MIEKNKKKNTKTIIYPIFEKCSCLTEDKFWVSVFQKCARGKFPRYFYFKNNLLTYRKGNKNKRLKIPKSESMAYINILKFFQEEAGILSKTDGKRRNAENKRKMIENMKDKNLEWKDVKTDKMKDLLIMEFIDTLCENNNFNQEEKNELITTIKKGFIMKCFTNNNILMEDNKISEISGLKFNKRKKIYEISKECLTKRPGRKVKGLGLACENDKSDIDFMELWNSYLKNLKEKKTHKINNYSTSSAQNSSDDFSKSTSTTKSK